LQFKDGKELNQILPKTIETQLQRYSLFSWNFKLRSRMLLN
jgi:hypothetical protein